MQSSIIGKVEKAHRYSQEPDRIALNDFSAVFRGNNRNHNVSYSKNRWSCSCSFFQARSFCAHTMALEKMLGNMLPAEGRTNFDAAEVAE